MCESRLFSLPLPRAARFEITASALGELAAQEGISINQLINSAVAEKVAALLTEEHLADRAKRASRKKFAAMRAKIPDVPAIAGDEIPDGTRRAMPSRRSRPRRVR